MEGGGSGVVGSRVRWRVSAVSGMAKVVLCLVGGVDMFWAGGR